MKKISWNIPALCLFAGIGASAAYASQITLTIGGVDTGTVTFTETGNDTLITAVSGTFDGSTIGGLIGAGEIGSNDNLFFTPAPYLDGSGVSFTLTTSDTKGFSDVNLFYDPSSVYESLQANGPENGEFEGPDTLTASGVPEPSTVCLTLIGTGLLFAVRKRVGHRVYQAR